MNRMLEAMQRCQPHQAWKVKVRLATVAWKVVEIRRIAIRMRTPVSGVNVLFAGVFGILPSLLRCFKYRFRRFCKRGIFPQ